MRPGEETVDGAARAGAKRVRRTMEKAMEETITRATAGRGRERVWREREGKGRDGRC